jgi:dienelactone hydrolase
MPSPSRLPALLAATALAAVAAACSPTGPSKGAELLRTPAAESRPFEVARWSETFTDTTRPTQPKGAAPAADRRSLSTDIYLPKGSGALPLIVFSHGLGGHPDKFTELLSTWARAGYIVAAPAFPLTNDRFAGASSNWTDVSNQPADVSFVITQMLALNRDPASRLHGRIARDRIGAAGLSLGGATTYAVAFNDCCRDVRVKAVEVLAGAVLVGGETDFDGHAPMLIVHGDNDPALSYQLAIDVYGRATAPVWFVTLLGGSHAPPFEDDDTLFDATVERLTTDFWDAALASTPGGFGRFEQAAAVPGLSTLQRK